MSIAGCSSSPSDETIEKEIAEHAAKCTWKIVAHGKEIYQTFSGPRIKVVAVEIAARSFKDKEGSVRFTLCGKKTGEGDVKNWYGWSEKSAAPYLSDSFRFEGEWLFRKYDKGWKVGEKPKMMVASFQLQGGISTHKDTTKQSSPRSDPVKCENNLKRMYKLSNIYMSKFGGRLRLQPKETGKDFWLSLTRTQPPLIEISDLNLLVCPASGVTPGPGICTYAGPPEDINGLGDGAVIGLCDNKEHGDQVVVMRRTGWTQICPRGGEVHKYAISTTNR